jgi:hypothetical protein
MYPKNSASPPSVFLGPIYLLSDNSVAITGVLVVVTVAGAQNAGAGTLTHRGNGVHEYVPSQAEANNDTFHVLIYKSGCTSDGVTVAPVGCDATSKVTPADIDGVTFARLARMLLAFTDGKTAVADNGDGTSTITFYAQNGSTVAGTVTYTRATGVRGSSTLGA